MSAVLEFKGVSKTYTRSDRPAVKGVDFSIQEGEILALLGESGSGKSTLLRLAAGLESPDLGEVFLHNEVVAGSKKWTPPEARNVGIVFQDGALFPHLTIAKNIKYGLPRLARKERNTRVEELLKLVGLEDKADKYPHELSGGEQQRIAIVRSIAPCPSVLLLDEPFASLDPVLRSGLREELRALLKKLKVTAILVTHDPQDTLSVADRVVIMRDGRVESHGKTEQVYRSPGSQYSAEMFGCANCIGSPDYGKVWVRPEYMRITKPGEGRIDVEITQCTTTPAECYLEVVPVDRKRLGTQKSWRVEVPRVHAYKVGETLGLDF